ncbi:MAG: PAS domain S-box protein [Bacteroidota bacterium]|nr:PAS domain S-box protein [Bacteroidota bacterium]
MSNPISILYIDNNLDDREIVTKIITKPENNMQLTVANTKTEFETLLRNSEYDVVMSELNIFDYKGAEVIDIVRMKNQNIPVIIITGSSSEETAAEAIRRGAADYVIKTTCHLQILPLIIKNALEKKQLQDAQNCIIKALKESEDRFRNIFEKASDGLLLADIKTKKFFLSNSHMSDMLGYSNDELCNLSINNIHPLESLPYVLEQFEKQVQGEITVATDIPVIRKDGSILYTDINSYHIIWDGRECIMGIFRDISERKQVEDALRKSETELRALFNAMQDVILVLDSHGRYLKIAPTNPALLYKPTEELLGKTVSEVFPKPQAEFFLDYIHRALETRQVLEVEYKLKISGKEIWFAGTISPMLADTVIWVARDITERKLVEEALRKSEAGYKRLSNEFQALLNAIPDNLTLQSSELMIIWANKAAAQSLGLTPNDLIGRYCYHLWHKRAEPCERCPVQRSFITGKPESEEVATPDGRFWDLRTVPFKEDNGKIIGIIEVGRDITRRKIAENKLQQSEERFSIVFKTSPFAITLTTMDEGRFIDANDSFLHLTGYRRDEVINSTIADLRIWVNPDERTQMLQNVHEQGHLHNFEINYRNKSGEHRIALTSVTVLDIGGAKCLLAFFHDITDRKRAEEALRESESKFRTVADTSVAAIFIYQGDKFIYMNPASEIMTGYNQSELLSIHFWDIVHPEFREIVKERGFARQRGDAVPTRYELKIIRKNGEERWLDFGAGAIQYEGKPAALGIAFDITERKQAEEQLRSSNKQMRQLMARMQAIREEESTRIAREIHDELGQTLTGIKMDLSFLEENLSEKIGLSNAPNVTTKINSISNLADSAIQTIRKITTELRPAILDSMGLVAAIEWQAEEFEKRTGIRCSYSSQVENVELDRDRSTAVFRILQESLTNITRHAKATKVGITLKRKIENLVMEIEDNGRGIVINELNKMNTFGILGMKERTAFLDGKFEITGAPSQGTTIRVSIPL